ncbi:MAG: glycosyltransferase family 9 protein [Verrucomicrobiales bacterium]|nr:glycosyltransferase family 9 protein [Verrucomicrobiales bacterium]
MENILLIRLKSIGDVVFTLPAVHRIRENFPDAKITFLTSKENAPLISGFREVDAVIALDRAGFKGGNPKRIWTEGFSLMRGLRGGKFSLVVDFQGFGETAWFAWLSGAPRRWGNVYGPGRRWAYTQGVTLEKQIHFADRNLLLLEQCGLRPGEVRNEFFLPENALAEARQFFLASGLDPAKSTLFIQPFTSTANKNWPLDRYLAVARHWRANGLQVLFGGGPADKAALEPVREAGFVVSAGAPLLVTAGLAQLSTLVLGSDTGILHLAVAMEKRVVMIINSVAPGRPYPFRHADWAIAPPTADRIVSNIQTGTVIEACERALAETGAAQ